MIFIPPATHILAGGMKLFFPIFLERNIYLESLGVSHLKFVFRLDIERFLSVWRPFLTKNGPFEGYKMNYF